MHGHSFTLCMLCNFACFFCQLLIFSKILSGIPSGCQNSLDSDQARHFVEHDLGPNCLQRLSAEDKSPLTGNDKNIHSQ